MPHHENTGETLGCADCLWEQAQSLSQAADLMARWLRGDLPDHPGHHGPPMPETAPITEPLLTLAACGLLTVGSQPGLHTDTQVQRAYLDLIGPDPLVRFIAHRVRAHHIRAHHWDTLTIRPARPPYPLDLIVTAGRRDTPADPDDPYLAADLATHLDPDGLHRHHPAGADPTDGDIRHADMGGLDPREWERYTRARSGWTTQDVLGRLRLDPPVAAHDLLATADLATALRGSRSMTLVDTAWGEPDRLFAMVAEAATQWHLNRART